jgi:hypothetical protein
MFHVEDKMIDPFNPNHNWYEQYWSFEEAARSPWRVPAALGSIAAFVLAGWIA